jgi:general secretion pathway protein A
LNEASLRQLKQRISLRCELRPLDFPETAAYIAGRIRIAGGKPADIFSREAVAAIYEASRGVPRTINVVCDNTLIGGFAAEAKPVTRALVQEVMRDFDLGGDTAPKDAAPKDAAPKAERPPAPPAAERWQTEPAEARAEASDAGHTTAPPAPAVPEAAPVFGTFTRRKRFSFF